MEFRLLGPFEVADGDRIIDVGSAKQRALLTVLLLHANEVVPTDVLVESLWPERAPACAVATLHSYISNLRRALEPGARARQHRILLTHQPGYRLHASPSEIDVTRFRDLAVRGRTANAAGDWTRGASLLREALGVWRGTALVDFAYDAFAQNEARTLEEERLRALEERFAADLALGRHSDLVAEIEGLVRAHPLREEFAEQLMLALYRSGRQIEALRQYQRVRRSLLDELGLEPGPALQRLERAILAHDSSLTPSVSTAPDTPVSQPAPAGNLRRALTSFVGREVEREALEGLLRERRLVTVTGPGGCGKSRLVLEFGGSTAWAPDGVWMVELAAVHDPVLVPSAVADAMGIPGSAERDVVSAVCNAIDGRHLLLLLDNCERMLAACRELVTTLLVTCPHLRVVATSREPLGIAGEQVWRLDPLSTPAETRADDWFDSEAVRLFAERASAVAPGFTVDQSNIASVAAICRRLDGLPLAIELAAARMSVISVDQIAARLADRFQLLRSRDEGRLPHHRTVRLTIDWSYEMLSSGAQGVLDRLSVFAGGFDLGAAEDVTTGSGVDRSAVLDALSELLEKSLLMRRPDEGGEARYRMLETVREYAAEHLRTSREDEAVCERFVCWCLALADRAAPELRGPAQRVWLRRLDVESDNLRAALAWAVGTRREGFALCLTRSLWWYWVRRSRIAEGRDWLQRVLALPETEAGRELRPGALAAAAYLAWMQYAHDAAKDLVDDALVAATHDADRALALAVAARVAFDTGLTTQAAQYDAEALACFRKLGDAWGEAWTLRQLAAVAARGFDLDEAAALARTSRSICEQLGDEWGVAGSLDVLVYVLQHKGELVAARELGEETVRRYRDIGDRAYLAVALHHLAAVLDDLGLSDAARDAALESRALDRDLGISAPVAAQ